MPVRQRSTTPPLHLLLPQPRPQPQPAAANTERCCRDYHHCHHHRPLLHGLHAAVRVDAAPLPPMFLSADDDGCGDDSKRRQRRRLRVRPRPLNLPRSFCCRARTFGSTCIAAAHVATVAVAILTASIGALVVFCLAAQPPLPPFSLSSPGAGAHIAGVYYINLDSSIERRERFLADYAKHPIPDGAADHPALHVVAATSPSSDGSDGGDDVDATKQTNGGDGGRSQRRRYLQPVRVRAVALTRDDFNVNASLPVEEEGQPPPESVEYGALGCALSHLSVLRRIAALSEEGRRLDDGPGDGPVVDRDAEGGDSGGDAAEAEAAALESGFPRKHLRSNSSENAGPRQPRPDSKPRPHQNSKLKEQQQQQQPKSEPWYLILEDDATGNFTRLPHILRSSIAARRSTYFGTLPDIHAINLYSPSHPPIPFGFGTRSTAYLVDGKGAEWMVSMLERDGGGDDGVDNVSYDDHHQNNGHRANLGGSRRKRRGKGHGRAAVGMAAARALLRDWTRPMDMQLTFSVWGWAHATVCPECRGGAGGGEIAAGPRCREPSTIHGDLVEEELCFEELVRRRVEGRDGRFLGWLVGWLPRALR